MRKLSSVLSRRVVRFLGVSPPTLTLTLTLTLKPNPNPNPNPNPTPDSNPNQVRFLGENAKKDPAEYLKFFAEFGQFIKVTLLVLEFGQFIKEGA